MRIIALFAILLLISCNQKPRTRIVARMKILQIGKVDSTVFGTARSFTGWIFDADTFNLRTVSDTTYTLGGYTTEELFDIVRRKGSLVVKKREWVKQ